MFSFFFFLQCEASIHRQGHSFFFEQTLQSTRPQSNYFKTQVACYAAKNGPLLTTLIQSFHLTAPACLPFLFSMDVTQPGGPLVYVARALFLHINHTYLTYSWCKFIVQGSDSQPLLNQVTYFEFEKLHGTTPNEIVTKTGYISSFLPSNRR